LLALLRIVTGLFAVVSLLASPMWVRCIEDDGDVAIESAWSLCCATKGPNDLRASIPAVHEPGFACAQDDCHCTDVHLVHGAVTTTPAQVHGAAILAWNGAGGHQAAKSRSPLTLEPNESLDTVGHSGSDLVALCTVRLLT
jgi:hypothetical protein